MIERVDIQNFGPLHTFSWENLGAINTVIGGNGSGKTFLLKALYSSIKTLEEYKRGENPKSVSEILFDKLYWTFQPEKIGDLVSKDSKDPLRCSIAIDGRDFFYTFGKDTIKSVNAGGDADPRSSNSIFLPAKEVLSLHHIILSSRERDNVFGFDDTYLDLARALRHPAQKGKNFAEFAQVRQSLKDITGGNIEYKESTGRWEFKRGNRHFAIGLTAEGIKKIAILDTLLGNRYLDRRSVVFIDEPESALHPGGISKLMDIIAMLAEGGIQFFIATHSYFVIKKLLLIAQQRGLSIPIISEDKGYWTADDLSDGIPDNPIIDESIELYKQEVALSLE